VSAKKTDGLVEVSVKDTGVGISKENIQKLFTKFGRIADSYATVAQATSTGLGLYITKNYIEKMGGQIWVESELGKGTTFIFSLPISQQQEEVKKEVATFIPRRIIK
jgi:signal transduction histidine kinase